MPLPSNVNTITVTGTYESPSGNALSGTVSFQPSADLTDSTGAVIVRAQAAVVGLVSGAFSIVLPCTDNTSLIPAGWTWTVTEAITGLPVRSYSVLLPHTLGSSVDLSTLVPVTPQTVVTPYLLASNNLADIASPATARSNLGLGSAATLSGAAFALTANNLSDLSNAATARTNLGLGSAATQASSAFDAAGAATAAQTAAQSFATSAVAAETSRAEAAEALLAPLASPALTGTPTAPTRTALTNSTALATTAYADAAVAVETGRAQTAEALKAPLVSPALTGSPTAPTQIAGDNSTKLATDAFVTTAVAAETTRAQAAEAAKLAIANNLSDLASTATARTNLGLGSAATQASSAFDAAGAASAAQTAAISAAEANAATLYLPLAGGTIVPATDATGILVVTTHAGLVVLDLDTLNRRVGVNTATPAEALDLGSTSTLISRLNTTSTAETDSSGTAETIRMHFGRATFNGAVGGSSSKNAIAWFDDTVSSTTSQVWVQAHNYLHEYDPQTFAPAGVNTSTGVVTYTPTGIAPINAWQVQFSTTGTLPGGLSAATNYYVKILSSSTFSIYNDSGLTSQVTLTSQGTGTHTMTPQLSYNNNHHQHFSIEVSNSDLVSKNTRLSIPWGFTQTQVGFFQSDVNVNDGALRINGQTGTNRVLQFGGELSDNLTPNFQNIRWTVQANSTNESGSNVGSDFQLIRASDTGAPIDGPLFVQRSTGFVGLGGSTNPQVQLDIGYSGSGTTAAQVNRGATTNFAGYQLATGGTTQWSVQMRNDSTNDQHFRDNVNARTPLKLRQSTGVAEMGLGVARGRTAVADAAYTVLTTDSRVCYTSITAARVVTLPSVSTATGQEFVIKDESGSCSGTNTITVTPASGTIDGAASKAITTAYGVLRVYSNGTNWFTY